MKNRLQQLKDRYKKLSTQLSDPAIISDTQKYKELSKEHANLEKTVSKISEFEKIKKDLKQTKELLKDPEMKKTAEEEIGNLTDKKNVLEKELKIAFLPKDSRDERSVIMEVRAGAGGDEAGLFAADLFRMYTHYAEQKGWNINIMNSNRTGIGGFKEIIFAVSGQDVYSKLKYESGVHRVQRIPETEKSGRIHTSTATVAVLPEAEEVDLKIDPKDLRIDTFCSSGPGGQSVNTTYSAVRIVHIPTEMTVSCQDEKSQLKNKEKALKVLRSRLLEQKQEKQRRERGEERHMQIGTGDRSEKIRTYNFPQDRVTDHRIKYTTKNLQGILDGNIDEIIGKLEKEDQARKLAKS